MRYYIKDLDTGYIYEYADKKQFEKELDEFKSWDNHRYETGEVK